jgi:predicted dehydrogenase
MTPPRFAIVGAGKLSTRRIYPCIAPAGARLVAVCDLEREKAEEKTALYGGNPYTDLEAMLEAEKPDGVLICTGPKGHAALAPVAMRRGIPVYTEKPPALTAADALAVARVSEETGVLCTTAFKKRYADCYQRATEFLAGFPAEDRYELSIDYGCGGSGEPVSGHGFLFDFCIHAIDLACYLFGHPTEVFAFQRTGNAYAVSLRFPSGAVGSLAFNNGRSWAAPTEEVEISVRGGNSMTIHNSSCWRIVREGNPAEWREPPTFISAGDSGNDTGHLAEIVDFVRAVREGGTTRSNIAESYRSMVLYEGIIASAESGRPVTLSYEV